MSFLLDALGKADYDRQRSHIPELSARKQNKPKSPLRKLLQGILLLSLLLLSFALGYFLRPFIDGDLKISVSAAEQGAQIQGSGEKKALAAVADKKPADKKPLAIDISVISYSDVPATRFAMLNGFVMHEGDAMASGERLIQINADHIVLEKQGTERKFFLNPK